MTALLQDIQYALRLLRRSPGFTAVALLSLALGIGANTAIFSVINTLLLRPMPVDDAKSLVAVYQTDERNPGNIPVSHLNFKDLKTGNDVFTDLAAVTFGQVNRIGADGKADQLQLQLVTGNYFDLIGAHFTMGRGFRADEDQALDANPVAVLSYPFWQARMGADPAIVGKTITLNRLPFTIVGVAPKGFTGTFPIAPSLWVPLMMHGVVQPGFDWYEQRRGLFLFPFGRLKPGRTVADASANLKTIMGRLEHDFPNDNKGRSVAVMPVLQSRVDPNGQGQIYVAAALLLGIVGIVLLIACANLANLLLARASRRRREIAVRLAIGADRARLVRQLLTESVVLAVLGAACGLVMAQWLIGVIGSSSLPLPLPVDDLGLGLDARVLAFTAALALVTGVIFGLAPALEASRTDVAKSIKDETVPAGAGRRFSLRKALVMAQVALSVLSLVAAGLVIRSLGEASRIAPGFDTAHVATLDVNLGREGYTPERGQVFYRDLVARAEALPGVTSAAVAESLPLGGVNFQRSVFLDQQDTTGRDRKLVGVNYLTPGFFTTAGIPLREGRDFDSRDDTGAPLVAIVNETLARQLWPGRRAIGERFRFFGDDAATEVIGIAADSKINDLAEAPTPIIYSPLRQTYAPAASLLVRTDAGAATLVPAIRQVVAQLDPSLSVLNAGTLADQVRRSLDGPRTTATMLSAFGALALLLAAIGIYGVTSFTVSQRTRELGVRMALGARPIEVLRLVLGQSMTVVTIGLGLGLALAVALVLVLKSGLSAFLVNVPAVDPLTFAGTAFVLALVAAAACLIPARRASRIDPLRALRQD